MIPTFLRPLLTLACTCVRHVNSADATITRRIVAINLQLGIDTLHKEAAYFDWAAFYANLANLPFLRILIISFNEHERMASILTLHSEMLQYPPNHVTYRIASRRLRAPPLFLPENDTSDCIIDHQTTTESNTVPVFFSHWHKDRLQVDWPGYTEHVWELTNPTAVPPYSELSSFATRGFPVLPHIDTSTASETFVEHDNIIPELLKRQGIDTTTAPNLPSEDELRSLYGTTELPPDTNDLPDIMKDDFSPG